MRQIALRQRGHDATGTWAHHFENDFGAHADPGPVIFRETVFRGTDKQVGAEPAGIEAALRIGALQRGERGRGDQVNLRKIEE